MGSVWVGGTWLVKLRALGARRGVTVEAVPPLLFTHSPPAEMPPPRGHPSSIGPLPPSPRAHVPVRALRNPRFANSAGSAVLKLTACKGPVRGLGHRLKLEG